MLVETALKHGIAMLPAAASCWSAPPWKTARWSFRWRTAGKLAAEESRLPRLGLNNIRERLRILYSGRASLELTSRDGASPRRCAYPYANESLDRRRRAPGARRVGAPPGCPSGNRDRRRALNGEEALELVARLVPDLLFLDIQMPGMTGFELLERLDEVPQVIFTTAYDQYAFMPSR